MIPLQNVDSFWDVLGLLISGLVLVAVAVAPILIKRQLDHNTETSEKLKKIDGQVSNGHPDPLRTDLDRALAMLSTLVTDVRDIRKDISGVRGDVGGARGEIREERDDRRRADADLRDDMNGRFTSLQEQIRGAADG